METQKLKVLLIADSLVGNIKFVQVLFFLNLTFLHSFFFEEFQEEHAEWPEKPILFLQHFT